MKGGILETGSTDNSPKTTVEPFQISAYIGKIKGSYKSMAKIDKDAKQQLDSMVKEAAESIPGENDIPQQVEEDGWSVVKRRRKSKNPIQAFIHKKQAPARVEGEEPLPSARLAKEVFGLTKKQQKKDFYSFQLTDRWRKKADRIASKLNMKKDLFGRPLQTNSYHNRNISASVRSWKAEKLDTAKRQREHRSFQRL